MSNSLRSIGFTLALMGTLMIMTFINPWIPDQVFAVLPFLLIFSYILLFVLIENAFKFFILRKHSIEEHTLYFTLKPIYNLLYHRLYYYGLLVLILFLYIKTIGTMMISMTMIMQIIISILIVEILLFVSRQSLYAYFLQEAILIQGFDGRIDIPLNSPIDNHPGFFYYTDFIHYSLHGDILELLLHRDQGKLRLQANLETQRQLIGLFQAKGIPAKTTIK